MKPNERKLKMKNLPNVGCEVCYVGYNGRSRRQSTTEAMVTGIVTKVTKDYIHVRNYEDGKVWKTPTYLAIFNL